MRAQPQYSEAFWQQALEKVYTRGSGGGPGPEPVAGLAWNTQQAEVGAFWPETSA